MAPAALLAGLDDPLVVAALTDGLGRVLGRPLTIAAVHAEVFDGSSSFATGRIAVQVAGGPVVRVFVKDLNPDHQLDEAKAVRPRTMDPSRLEVWMYEHVLPLLALGTPRHFGTVADVDAGHLLLLLEDVGPKRLSRLGDFALWRDAAAWLARLHGAPAAPVNGWDLPVVDADYFRSRCDRLSQLGARLDVDDRALIERARSQLDDLIDQVDATPRGIIHGEFFGKNVVIRQPPGSEPIAVVDWETAAVGPQFLDLACITAGRWTRDQRIRMQRSYHRGLVDGPGTTLSWHDLRDGVDAATKLSALAWLGRWADGDTAHIARWLAELRFAFDTSGGP